MSSCWNAVLRRFGSPPQENFFTEARKLLRHTAEAIRKVRAVPQASSLKLRVGYAPSPTAEILPHALSAFQRTAPWAKVELLDQSTEEFLAGLLAEAIDVALVVQPALKHGSGLIFEKLLRASDWYYCAA